MVLVLNGLKLTIVCCARCHLGLYLGRGGANAFCPHNYVRRET
jgi:hypothetical protein